VAGHCVVCQSETADGPGLGGGPGGFSNVFLTPASDKVVLGFGGCRVVRVASAESEVWILCRGIETGDTFPDGREPEVITSAFLMVVIACPPLSGAPGC